MLNLRIARQMIQKILSMREWNAVLPWGWEGKSPSGALPGFGLRECSANTDELPHRCKTGHRDPFLSHRGPFLLHHFSVHVQEEL